jgi:hypothetical protein
MVQGEVIHHRRSLHPESALDRPFNTLDRVKRVVVVRQTRTIQLAAQPRQARATPSPPFHSSKRATVGLPTVNSITTLLFGRNRQIADGTGNTQPILRHAK